MKFIGLALVGLVGIVNGQDVSSTSTSSAAASTSTVLPISTALIPTNITTTCSSFLTALNTDPKFTTCMSPLSNLTALYNPLSSTGATESGVTLTSSTIISTLTQLCSASSGCSNGLIRSYLTDFYSACTAELVHNNQIREMYDFLYVVNPLRGAVCARDSSSQKYCVLELATLAAGNGTAAGSGSVTNSSASAANTTAQLTSFASTGSSLDLFAHSVAEAAGHLVITTSTTASTISRRLISFLSSRQSTSTQQPIDSSTIITPNTTTYLSTGLPYLFLLPTLSPSILCSTCTKSILSAYVSWEASVPYALGLSTSPILGSQAALFAGVGNKCGEAFVDGIVASAGVVSANGTVIAATSAAERQVQGQWGVVGALLVGVVGVWVL